MTKIPITLQRPATKTVCQGEGRTIVAILGVVWPRLQTRDAPRGLLAGQAERRRPLPSDLIGRDVSMGLFDRFSSEKPSGSSNAAAGNEDRQMSPAIRDLVLLPSSMTLRECSLKGAEYQIR
jgi:hypothetical protein